jgi:hypothetical protein
MYTPASISRRSGPIDLMVRSSAITTTQIIRLLAKTIRFRRSKARRATLRISRKLTSASLSRSAHAAPVPAAPWRTPYPSRKRETGPISARLISGFSTSPTSEMIVTCHPVVVRFRAIAAAIAQ